MKPRVGHIVWYPFKTWSEGPLRSFAAIVTRHTQDDLLDLMVFDPDSEPYHRRNVPHDEGGERAETWRWPVDDVPSPYR